MKRNKGITLIALVITIIVLLILAGVAIAMLSGENGILKKAAEAKTNTEEGQKKEEVALATAELETYFLTNNLKYKCSNGFITGFTVNGHKVEENIESFEKVLQPLGYKVTSKYKYDAATGTGIYIPIEESEKTDPVQTGMTVEKGENKLSIVIFGDCIGDGFINLTDANYYKRFLLGRDVPLIDAIKAAMDVNNDGKNDVNDYVLIKQIYKDDSYKIDQNRYAPSVDTLIEDKESYQVETYTNELFNNVKDNETYSLKRKSG